MKCKYKKFLKAAYINYDEDYCGSGSSTFTKPTVTTPIIVITGTTAIIACAISGVTIYYTLDGSTPTSSSTLYTGAITLTLSCVIKAIAVKPGMSDSEVASENYVHYLTAWRLIGNSVVHTDEYLTQWKVSGNSQIQQYLTQWKVEGNSVVDNNAILSCGDLGQDGKYHVKISNGVDVFDIALTEPLRKVSGVADSIEFVNGVATLTRKFASDDMGNMNWSALQIGSSSNYRMITSVMDAKSVEATNKAPNMLTIAYTTITVDRVYSKQTGISINTAHVVQVYDPDYNQSNSASAFKAAMNGVELIYELATPTTEVIQAPQIAVSSTYTSANDVAYSSFTYANPLIYSCGDYSDVDGKYHVKIYNGVTIYDIPLTEPLRKVNDVADSIEFANGVATLTRAFGKVDWLNDTFEKISASERIYFTILNNIKTRTLNILSSLYITVSSVWASITDPVAFPNLHINSHPTRNMLRIIDEDKNGLTAVEFAQANANAGVELIYELATPTTEVIQVSPFPVSPTDTYTSVNDTPYSAFEYKKNVEIWSCGEYSEVDNKWHIRILPEGYGIVDIALDEPLRKVNDVADKIEFADGVATLTRNFASVDLGDCNWTAAKISGSSDIYRMTTYSVHNTLKVVSSESTAANILTAIYNTIPVQKVNNQYTGIAVNTVGCVIVFDGNYNQSDSAAAFKLAMDGIELIYELATPTTETIQVPQIQEAESYTCVISQGGKAVEWSSFETE